jgi:NAD(P)-dependent dehydrogenase (short-subunit alcohol dehydrogenase family)
MDLRLAGQVALVAGGGRGIGRATALALAREGARVAVLARTAAELATVEGALALPADLTDLAAVDAALATLRAALGPPTLLVLAAAALYRPVKLHNLSDADATALLALDLGAAVALSRRVLPDMLAARAGRIVAISSLASRTGLPGATLYAAAKSGLEGLMRGLAVDYSRHGITANAVAVGFAETPRLEARLGGDAGARARLERATASRRLVAPDEVADVVAFLCSPRAAAITGAVIDVTHGAHLGNL